MPRNTRPAFSCMRTPVLALLFFAGPLLAVDAPPLPKDIEPEQAVRVIDDLAQRGVLPPAVAAAERARWQTQPAEGGLVYRLLWIAAGIIVVGSAIRLLHIYLWPLMRRVSPVAYEALAWLACIAVIGVAWRVGPPSAGLAALPGLIGLIGAVTLSYYLHVRAWSTEHSLLAARIAAFVLSLIWAVASVVLQSELVGYLAVAGLLTALGLSVQAGVGWIGIGFSGRVAVIVCTIGAFVLASLGLLLHTSVGTAEPWCYLLPGASRLGSAIGFIGLLVLSTGWVQPTRASWWMYNLLALVAMLGCAALGDNLRDPWLKGLGATMTAVFLIEKWVELAWRHKWLLWGQFVGGAFLWAACWLFAHHPELFRIMPAS